MDWDGTSERRNDPLTEEQLGLISTWTQRSARAVLHRYRRTAIGGFLILLAASAFVWSDSNHKNTEARNAIVKSGQIVSIYGCNRDYRTTEALRGVLTSARTFQVQALKRGDISQEQFDRTQSYYTAQLAKLPLPDCRKAGKVLTSETDEIPPVPAPLYPHSTK